VALTPAFADDSAKQTQWKGFLKKSKLTDAPADLSAVVNAIAGFLVPVAAAICSKKKFDQVWVASGSWKAN